ncbi:hypothetical protein FRX31_023813 [Thalictrum thalictroides]|uniref:Uncharacterized protein n=1 Tax=Thalictrum thalictroides TaxID=46969 RepID=A0A7J6VNC0_THATH|nr:hypothetical protein FRX31_023813 [Thalictrum thalictroides]
MDALMAWQACCMPWSCMEMMRKLKERASKLGNYPEESSKLEAARIYNNTNLITYKTCCNAWMTRLMEIE